MTIKLEQTIDRSDRAAAAAPERKDATYQPPRVTRKRSLERVTLGSGTVGPGGTIGGN
jgi:hypothetical protein